jgi:hypothetical protein
VFQPGGQQLVALNGSNKTVKMYDLINGREAE